MRDSTSFAVSRKAGRGDVDAQPVTNKKAAQRVSMRRRCPLGIVDMRQGDRECALESSGHGVAEGLGFGGVVLGTSFIPHLGQVPGALETTSGCMGQT